ncbi:MAG TPA: LysR family transcriptional regulator [Kofleriaceae bacterium]|nr:LysR family transcriptional regulator [Kofleriaceae bacterium]
MDLSALQVFVDVIRRGSFAAVARDRRRAPSSISRTIAGLERELAVRLFQRSTRQLVLTAAGQRFFARIAPLVGELEAAASQVGDEAAQVTGRLCVTAPVTFGQVALVPLLPELARLHPALAFDLRLTDAAIDLAAERVDVALRLGTLDDSSLVATRLFAIRYVVCASPRYLAAAGTPARPADLADHDGVLLTGPAFAARWLFRDRRGRITAAQPRPRLAISNVLALCDCAAAGMGITCVPSWAAARYLRDGALTALFAGHAVTATSFAAAAWLVYPSRSYLPLKVRRFVDFVAPRLRALDDHGAANG